MHRGRRGAGGAFEVAITHVNDAEGSEGRGYPTDPLDIVGV